MKVDVVRSDGSDHVLPLLESLLYSTLGALAVGYTIGLLVLFVNARGYKPPASTSFLPTVSLVIPTYNEAAVIGRKLENVLQLVYPRDRLEVMVVDSASTDDTREIVQNFASRHQEEIRVRLVEQSVRLGKTEALNEALRQAENEIFALTDADVTFPPDSLKKLVANLEDPGIGAVSGVEVPIGAGNPVHNIEADYRRIYTAIRMAEASTDTPFMCESELSAYRRAILEPLRSGGMCDDIELTVAVRSMGYKSKYDLCSPFFETEAGTLVSKLKHKFRRGMANQHALIRNASVLFNRSFGRYGSVVYPFEFFVHIVSPVLMAVAFCLLLASIVISPSSALVAVGIAPALAVPSLVIVRQLMSLYSNPEISRLEGSGSWILGAIAFLAFQGVLLGSLVRLAIKGPQVKWGQVAGTRGPVTVVSSGLDRVAE